MTHTAGLWFSNGNIIRADKTGSCVAICATKDTTNEESLGNACLISAAPFLLESLEWILWYCNNDKPNGYNAIKDKTIAAIAKARGEA